MYVNQSRLIHFAAHVSCTPDPPITRNQPTLAASSKDASAYSLVRTSETVEGSGTAGCASGSACQQCGGPEDEWGVWGVAVVFRGVRVREDAAQIKAWIRAHFHKYTDKSSVKHSKEN